MGRGDGAGAKEDCLYAGKEVSVDREKIAAAAAKRRAKVDKIKTSSSSTGWVSDAVNKKKQSPILSDLRDYFIQATAERNRDRDTAHIHPSEMAKSDWCPRQTCYRISDVPPDEGHAGEKLYWRLASIFEEGHDIHDKHQRALWEMGELYGVWGCRDCDHTWWALSPAVCESCASLHIDYREVPISNPEFHLIGHTDGIHQSDGIRNLEVKSVGIRTIEIEIPGVYLRWKESGADLPALWTSIKIPFPSHQRQVQIYMDTLRAMGFEIDETQFIYEFKATQDLKGFIVKYNERAARKMTDVAVLVLQHREDGTDMDRPEWAHAKHSSCKECPWQGRCWA